MSLRVVSIAVLVGASPALAFDTSKLDQGGSLPLSDIMPLISKSPRLQKEVKQALTDSEKKADDLMCDGTRFSSAWPNLAGERVSPYTCDFGGKWLQLNATVRVTDRNGRAIETVTRKAMKDARKVTETNPRWRWTAEDPSKDK